MNMTTKQMLTLLCAAMAFSACKKDEDEDTTDMGAGGAVAGGGGGAVAGGEGGAVAGGSGGAVAGGAGGAVAGGAGGAVAGGAGGEPCVPAGGAGGAGGSVPPVLATCPAEAVPADCDKCTLQCGRLADCATADGDPDACPGLDADSRIGLLNGCLTSCLESPFNADVVAGKATCEEMIPFVKVLNASFKASCEGTDVPPPVCP